MIFALDYDGTYTASPDLWDYFISYAHKMGHRVLFVTMRNSDNIQELVPEQDVIETVYTNRAAKKAFVETIGLKIDVWIDDNPGYIFNNAV